MMILFVKVRTWCVTNPEIFSQNEKEIKTKTLYGKAEKKSWCKTFLQLKVVFLLLLLLLLLLLFCEGWWERRRGWTKLIEFSKMVATCMSFVFLPHHPHPFLCHYSPYPPHHPDQNTHNFPAVIRRPILAPDCVTPTRKTYRKRRLPKACEFPGQFIEFIWHFWEPACIFRKLLIPVLLWNHLPLLSNVPTTLSTLAVPVPQNRPTLTLLTFSIQQSPSWEANQ